MKRKQVLTFVAVCALAASGLAIYLFQIGSKTRTVSPAPVQAPAAEPASAVYEPAKAQPGSAPAPGAATVAVPVTAEPMPHQATSATDTAPPRSSANQRIYFRYTGVDSHYGKVAWIETGKPGVLHYADSLNCEVVHVSGGHGICLSADRGVFTTYAATLFDAKTFAPRGTFALKGIPSRARVSVDGRLAAFTVFVSGHGYSSLDFSTQTLLVDFAKNTVIDDLETFNVTRDGAPLSNPDFNFWGVTFTPDAKNFYATLSTAGKHYLIRGDIAARSARIIHENVECPSLSPDTRRVAYKKRLMEGNRVQWQLHVLDLESGRETALSEKRSIDDQLEWLDDRHVLYSVPSADDGSSPSTDIWQVSIDARSAPRLFLRNAYSPAAARGTAP